MLDRGPVALSNTSANLARGPGGPGRPQCCPEGYCRGSSVPGHGCALPRPSDEGPIMNEADPPVESPPGVGPPRLASLDVFRGLTIAGMIVVNNPGSWSAVYPPLRHAEWDGWTPTDLVFPF